MNSTFEIAKDEHDDHNGTFTKENEKNENVNPVSNGSATISRGPRERQKTMVVQAPVITELQKYFANAKLTMEIPSELEKTVLSIVQRSEAQHSHQMKRQHVNAKAAINMYTKVIAQTQRMLSDLTATGEYVHKSRAGTMGPAVPGQCMGKCDIALRLQTEIQQRHDENKSLSKKYDALYDEYKKIREALHMQRAEYGKLHDEVLVKERKALTELRARYVRLRQNADEQLKKASIEYDNLVAKHAEDTQGLRLKNRLLETDNASKTVELNSKETKISELKSICDQLMGKLEPGSEYSDTDA